jgi:superkiller protein 3
MHIKRVRAGAACAAILALHAVLPTPAFAISAGDARTRSFKLQSEGMKLHREGHYPEAIAALKEAVNIQLNSFMAWYYLGLCLSAERQYTEAIDPLKIALDLEPDYVQAHVALGDVHLKLGEIGEARASYLRALGQQANYAAALDGMGRLEEAIGNDTEAESDYRKALEINVAFADAYTHLGEMYLRKARLQDATDLFLKAITVKPDFAEAYTRLGVALSRQGRFDDAIAAARKSFELAPRDPEPHIALARIDLEMQNLDRADAELEQALAIDPENVYGHLLRAALANARGEPDRAVAVLDARLSRPIEDQRLKRQVVEGLKRARGDAATLKTLEAALAAGPQDPTALAALGRFEAGIRNVTRAATLLDAAAAAAPPAEADGLRMEAGLASLTARRYPDAITRFDAIAAAAADPVLRLEATFDAGVARAGAGDDRGAEQNFRDYLKTHPDEAAAHLYLGNALLRQGRREEARRAYEAYLERGGVGPEPDRVRLLVATLPASTTPAAAPSATSPATSPASPAPAGSTGGGKS